MSNPIKEVFLLRSVSCLSILMLHVISRVYAESANPFISDMSLLLTFGTPVFVFISAFIMSYSYRDQLPGHFWKNRFHYVFLPYVCFGTFYAVTKAFEQSAGSDQPYLSTMLSLLWRNLLLGDFHGYFILVILQFYALQSVFLKHIHRFSPRSVILVSLAVNLLYLGFFNFVPRPDSSIAEYIWGKLFWIPFPGWFFYFTIAYYSGRSVTRFAEFLEKRKYWIMAAVLLTGTIVVLMKNLNILAVIASKRVDMLFFVTSMIMFLFYLAGRINVMPRIVLWISQFSFGIYLFHPFYLAILVKAPLPVASAVKVLFLFIMSILLSVVTVYGINKLPYGSRFVGKIGIGSSQTDDGRKKITPAAAGVNT